MLNRLTDSLDFQSQALVLRAERQRLIASNIANGDTPGYVARDMNFAQALRDARGSTAAGRPGPGGLAAASGSAAAAQAGHIPLTAPANSFAGALLYATPSQTNLDGNTVDMDRERASFADNTVKYEATLRFLGSTVRTTLSAITGQ